MGLFMKKEKDTLLSLMDTDRINSLYNRVNDHITQARQRVQRTIDTEMVRAYWLIGQEIVEEEQFGYERSEYGTAVLHNLSMRLQQQYKRGFSVDTLERARRFYIIYQEVENSAAVRRKSQSPSLNPNLSWIHYTHLCP